MRDSTSTHSGAPAEWERERGPLREPHRDAAGDAEHAERRDERRQAQPRDEQARSPARTARRRARPRQPRPGLFPVPDPTHAYRRGVDAHRHHRDERDDRADRQVDPAADEDEQHPERDDRGDGPFVEQHAEVAERSGTCRVRPGCR